MNGRQTLHLIEWVFEVCIGRVNAAHLRKISGLNMFKEMHHALQGRFGRIGIHDRSR